MLELIIMKFGSDYNVRMLQCDWKKVDNSALNNTWTIFKDGMSHTSEDTIGGPSESYTGINYLKGKRRSSIPFDTGGAITNGGDDTSEDEDKDNEQ
jgi:hypothetical protein